MAVHIPDDVFRDAFRIFTKGNRKNDFASSLAFSRFLVKAEESSLSLFLAQAALGDKTERKISAFIAEVRAEIGISSKIASQNERTIIARHLNEIRNVTKQTLSKQNELQSEIADLKAINKDLRKLSGQISKDVVRAVKNTTFRAAFSVGLATGLLAGVPGGLVSNYYYERHLSREALSQPLQRQGVVSASPPPPKGDKIRRSFIAGTAIVQGSKTKRLSNVVPLIIDPYGACDPVTGKNVIRLLNEGKMVSLPAPGAATFCLR